MKKLSYIAWPCDLSYQEALLQKKYIFFKKSKDLISKLSFKRLPHLKEVCDGKRSHTYGYKIAYYDSTTHAPLLKESHLSPIKKGASRKIQCLNDLKIFKNCKQTAEYYNSYPHQISLCARGILKSIYWVNKENGKKERLRFAHLDKDMNPILTERHHEHLSYNKQSIKVRLINRETIDNTGLQFFSSIKEYCEATGVNRKRASRFRNDNSINLFGYEFVEVK